MIVLVAIMVSLLGAALLFAFGSIIYLLHLVLVDELPNYSYWVTRWKIVKVTYGDGSIKFMYKRSKLFGLPYSWTIEDAGDSYQSIKEKMGKEINRLDSKRVVKEQILK